MTEGKSAALQRLAVPSKRHIDLATGTGTDQFCVAAPLSGGRPLTSASPHMKLGELIGLATRHATLEALRWQNGLEASYTRGVFHALGRYGVQEATFFDDIAPFLERGGSRAAARRTARRRSTSRWSAPRRTRWPRSAIACATARFPLRSPPMRWRSRRRRSRRTWRRRSIAGRSSARRLRPHASGDVKTLVLRAVALGWSEKWRTGESSSLASLVARSGRCWRRPSPSIWPSAIRSTPGIRFG